MKQRINLLLGRRAFAALGMVGIFGLLFMSYPMRTVGQDKPDTDKQTRSPAGDSAAVPSQGVTTNRIDPKAEEKCLEVPDRSRLMEGRFQERESGVFERKQMTFGELKQLIQFKSGDMKRIMSCSPLEPSYLVSFKNARCLITFLGGVGQGPTDSNVVDVVVNTNALPAGHKPMPKASPPVKEKTSVTEP